MKTFLFGIAALPFLAGIAVAGQPVSLSDAQMDRVTAGLEISVVTGTTTLTQILEVTAFEPPANNTILAEPLGSANIPHVEDDLLGTISTKDIFNNTTLQVLRGAGS